MLEFDYLYLPSGGRVAGFPIIQVELSGLDFLFHYECLIDSGAEYCLFHAETAEAMGIRMEEGTRIELSGVSKNTSLTAYLHDISYRVKDIECRAQVAFTRELSAPYGILGREGFFDKFIVEINHQEGKVSLMPQK